MRHGGRKMLQSTTVSAAMGIVFFLLAIVATIPFETRGVEPQTATDDSIRDLYRADAGAVRAYTILTVAGWATFVWFVAALATRFHAGAPGLATATLGLGVGSAVLHTFAMLASGAIAFANLDEFPDGPVVAWYAIGGNMGNLAIEMGTFFRGLFLVAAGWAAARTRVLPAWFGWTAIGLGAMGALAGFGLMSETTKPYAFIPGFAGHILFYFWVAVASALLTRRSMKGQVDAPAPSPSRMA